MGEALAEAFIKGTDGTAIEFGETWGHSILAIEIEEGGVMGGFGVLELEEGEGF